MHSKINQSKVVFGPNLVWTYRSLLLLSAFAVHLQDWKIEKKMGRIIFQCYQLFVKPVFVSLLLVIGGRVGGCRGHAFGISFFFTIFQSIFCSSVTIILIFIWVFFGLVSLSLRVSERMNCNQYRCNKITTTWIQIHVQNWNWFFSNASHQIII